MLLEWVFTVLNEMKSSVTDLPLRELAAEQVQHLAAHVR